jgi:glycosyltransferase involved in cell wall biosynthesis
MIYLMLPPGSAYGWGMCTRYLVKELSKLAAVRCVAHGFDRGMVGNELEYRFYREKMAGKEEAEDILTRNDRYPLLQAIVNHNMEPYYRRATGPRKVGYIFAEATNISAEAVTRGEGYFDLIATGSTWCTELLRQRGFRRVTTVLQGIDPLLFHPSATAKEFFRDRFVIFSGGKFEYRKGQDIVLRAFKALQDKYPDLLLVASWFNPWREHMDTMSASRLIRYRFTSNDPATNLRNIIHENGVDVERVVLLPPYPQETLACIVRQTDVGLFPSRCEGGTNLVLMEYMACGEPAIASFSSGHKDIVNRDTALLLEQLRPVVVIRDGQRYAEWQSPDLDETIHQLEWAYHHRDELARLGEAGGRHLAQFTWRRTAERFHDLLTRPESATGSARSV